MKPGPSLNQLRSGVNGVLNVKSTVTGFVTRTILIGARRVRNADAVAGSSVRSMLNFTAAASHGVPS